MKRRGNYVRHLAPEIYATEYLYDIANLQLLIQCNEKESLVNELIDHLVCWSSINRQTHPNSSSSSSLSSGSNCSAWSCTYCSRNCSRISSFSLEPSMPSFGWLHFIMRSIMVPWNAFTNRVHCARKVVLQFYLIPLQIFQNPPQIWVEIRQNQLVNLFPCSTGVRPANSPNSPARPL